MSGGVDPTGMAPPAAVRAPAPPGPDGVTLGQAPVTLGAALGLTVRMWRRALAPIALLGGACRGASTAGTNLIAAIPLAWLDQQVAGWVRFPTFATPRHWLADAVWYISLSLFAGAVAALAGLLLVGRAASPGAIRSAMAGRWGTFLVLGLSLWLLGEANMQAPPSVQGLSSLVFVAGVIGWPAVFLVVPALVLEQRDVPSAVRRSLALSRGSRWMLFGLSVATVAPGVVASLAMLKMKLLDNPALALLVGLPVEVVLEGLALIAPAAAFHLLRTAKEGSATGALAEVFE